MPDLLERILNALVARVKALDLDGIGDRVYREKAIDDAAIQYLPSIIVTYIGEQEQYGAGDWKADVIGYPGLVSVYEGTMREHDPEAEARELAWLGAIDDALRYQRLEGVPEVTNCVPEPRSMLEAVLADAPELQRSSKLYRFIARRGRAA